VNIQSYLNIVAIHVPDLTSSPKKYDTSIIRR